MKETRGYEYTTDLLVIGCGFSGMWAAMRARDFLDERRAHKQFVRINLGISGILPERIDHQLCPAHFSFILLQPYFDGRMGIISKYRGNANY